MRTHARSERGGSARGNMISARPARAAAGGAGVGPLLVEPELQYCEEEKEEEEAKEEEEKTARDSELIIQREEVAAGQRVTVSPPSGHCW